MTNNYTHMNDVNNRSITVAQARELICQHLNPVIESERVALRDSLGRVLAADIQSPANVPNYDNSAMDGYAFNADDVSPTQPTRLRVIGTVFAGKVFDGTVARGECVRIMTGGAIPAGADTVIMQEDVTIDGDNVCFAEAPNRTANVRYAGEDLKFGQAVLTAGHWMRPADLGLLASLGIAEVSVYRRLKVAFFSTGDELTNLDQPLEIGQVYDSNRYTLYGMLSRMGVEIIDLGAIADNPVLLEEALLTAASKADVVITSGGVSVGEADFMKSLLAKHGEVVFWKIAMKPGRPLAFGKVQGAHYFGLPGNPVAVMVTFYQFVREALLVLMGQATPMPLPIFNVLCTAEIKKSKGRTEFQRGVLFADADGTWKVKPTGAQGSAILSSMSAANCFIVLGEDVAYLDAGAMVQVQVLDGIV